MEVFIGNLAVTVTHNDLIGFFKTYSNKARIRIVEKRQEDGTRVRYGIAEFDTDKLALRVIKKLNGKQLRGQPVLLREYFHRYYANERRAVNWRNKPWNGVERRQQDRRKQQSVRPGQAATFTKEATEEADESDKVHISGYAHLARKN